MARSPTATRGTTRRFWSRNNVRRRGTGGMVLGLFEMASSKETVQLTPGDVIIAFSDGAPGR